MDVLEESRTSPEAVDPVKQEPPVPGIIDWAHAQDCRGKLTLLREGLVTGRIETLETTPFTLVSATKAPGRLLAASAGWPGTRLPQASGAEMVSGQAASRCVIRLGAVAEHKAEHRVLGRERVRSSYQSGSHREKNPAYDAAQARLRKAERANKTNNSSVISVGDPLIDLVGTLIGGAITGVGQWSEGDPVDEAIDALTATPRSIEQPIYRSYHFERARVRASREAIIPLILTDRELRKSWRVSLKRREVKDIAVLDGLDRQDRDYAKHRENGMTDQEFRQWQAEPPDLPLEDMVASLIGAPVSSSLDRVSSLDDVDDQATFREDQALDAAALPRALYENQDPLHPQTSSVTPIKSLLATSAAGESLVRIIGKEREGHGVYVTPALVLTASDLVEGQGLVDVEDRQGGSVLGLVTTVDRSRGLALIQVPRPGVPAVLDAVWSGPPDGTDRPARDHDNAPIGIRDRSLEHDKEPGVGPILKGRNLVGFRSRQGPDISLAEIKLFLDEQDVAMISQQ